MTEQVAEAGKDWVHWGATSQDAIDTALMLQMRDSLALLIVGLHQAVPITFGLKAARWLALTTC